MIEKILIVKNRAGIHARPAALIAQTANKYACEIIITRDDTSVNAKSIMGIITMAAGYNTSLIVKANGTDEQEAVQALEALFDSKFAEE
ncbi:MAG: HPr family phosphocarrier protein [Treponema sp.]|nr:HPr family phosphocarrier protein [Treponema sp.]